MTESTPLAELPVVIIGAGPVGLAAAAHVVARDMEPLIFEAGSRPAAAVSQWGHIGLFSPWKYNIDQAARALLDPTGWVEPNGDYLPTGAELVAEYLAPLAATPQLSNTIRTQTRVIAVSRVGKDRTRTPGRGDTPFLVRTQNVQGEIEDHRARAVIDTSGTWESRRTLSAKQDCQPSGNQRPEKLGSSPRRCPTSSAEIEHSSLAGTHLSSGPATRQPILCWHWGSSARLNRPLASAGPFAELILPVSTAVATKTGCPHVGRWARDCATSLRPEPSRFTPRRPLRNCASRRRRTLTSAPPRRRISQAHSRSPGPPRRALPRSTRTWSFRPQVSGQTSASCARFDSISTRSSRRLRVLGH